MMAGFGEENKMEKILLRNNLIKLGIKRVETRYNKRSNERKSTLVSTLGLKINVWTSHTGSSLYRRTGGKILDLEGV